MNVEPSIAEAFIRPIILVRPWEPLPAEWISYFHVNPSVKDRKAREEQVRKGLVGLANNVFNVLQKALALHLSGLPLDWGQHTNNPSITRVPVTLPQKITDLFHDVFEKTLGIRIRPEAATRYFITWDSKHEKELYCLFGRTPAPSPSVRGGQAPVERKDNLERMNDLRKEGKWTDVSFEVEGQVFPAHKLILSKSRFFVSLIKEISTTNSPPKPITLPDIHAPTFDLLLQYLYTGKVLLKEQKLDQVMDLAKLADKIEDSELKNICHRHLSLSLSPETLPAIIEHAKKLKDLILFRACLLLHTKNVEK